MYPLQVATFLGTGSPTSTGDGGPVNAATVNDPVVSAMDGGPCVRLAREA